MRSLYQFDNNEINKDNLLTDKLESLYINENFKVDNKMVALLNISECNLKYGNTIVVHATLGVFFDPRTTSQIMNEFHKLNGFGFASTRVIAEIFKITRFLPFAFAYVSYMPMAGGSKKNVDWIGLHLIDKYQQRNRFAYFTTVHGFKLKVKFPHGDLDTRIHNVCILNEKSISDIETMLSSGRFEFNKPEVTGLIRRNRKCNCKLHLILVKRRDNADKIVETILDYIFRHIGIESIDKDSVIKYYKNNLAKVRKLY